MFPTSFTPQILRQLQLLQLRSRRKFLGTRQGGHHSLKRGHGIEFADFRKYELGDSPRSIDWGVYARTDRLYVRRFQEEENISLLILLDTSASMDTPADDGKWARAKEIALAIAYVALMEQDSVIIAPLSGTRSPLFSGARAVHSVANFLKAVPPPSGQKDFGRAVQLASGSVGFPGLAVLVSDLLLPVADIVQGCSACLARNLDTSVVHVVGPHDKNPFLGADSILAVDSESEEELEFDGGADVVSRYQRSFRHHTAALYDYFDSRQIRHCTVESEAQLTKILISTLTSAGLVG